MYILSFLAEINSHKTVVFGSTSTWFCRKSLLVSRYEQVMTSLLLPAVVIGFYCWLWVLQGVTGSLLRQVLLSLNDGR